MTSAEVKVLAEHSVIVGTMSLKRHVLGIAAQRPPTEV